MGAATNPTDPVSSGARTATAEAAPTPAQHKRESRFGRRWRVFKRHRRGYVSLILLTLLVVVTLPAELWISQRPLVVKYGGEWYFPVFFTYPETTFGGIFETEADYHDEGVEKALAAPDVTTVWPLIRFDYSYVDTTLPSPAPSPPDDEHYLGTDDRGRDLIARLVYGFRLSILFSLALAVFGSVLGILIGAVQGFFGGVVDLLAQRFIEVWGSQNELYLLIILTVAWGEPSLKVIFFLLSLFGWMGLSQYVRAEFLRARQYDYVQSAIALGAGRVRVMLRHILPNTMTPVITFFPFRVAGGITGLTALDFLGMGVPSPTPSFGELLAQGKSNLMSWWIISSVFIVIVLTIMLFNFVGEALQKALDPNAGL